MVWENLAPRKPQQYYRRLHWVAIFICCLFAVLLLRLLWMQVWEGGNYLQQAQTNSVRLIPQHASRGLILDRNLQLLVGNTPSLSLGLTPAPLLHDPALADAVIHRLADLTGEDEQEIRAKFQQQQNRPFAPVRLLSDVPRSMAAMVEEMRDQLPGVDILSESKRAYPQRCASHLLGYVGEITDSQLESMADKGYRLGDLIGQTGLERVYDSYLKGEDGGLQIKVNATGKQLGLLYNLSAVPGNNLILTLDLRLQKAAEEALADQAGAVVALDPRNGEVLALVSKPDYDLNLFTNRILARDWEMLRDDERHPLTNRAIQGLYPPGSVFKLITAAAGLETGAIDENTVFNCPGIFWISTWPYRCWKEIGHNAISLHRAIVESCDIYFYHVGLKTKVDVLHQYATEFGLGSPTGIDLPNEAGGLVPSADWKEHTQHMPWFPGNTVMMSIGQGYTLATPLQLAVLAATIANGGAVYRPHLLKRVTDTQGNVLEEPKPILERQLELKPSTLQLVQKGMEDAVNVAGGTAWRARVDGLTVAGKTGTAQNPHGEDHANFVSYAPAENPQMVVAVVVENGGEGGLTAAPIAKKLYEIYFGKDQ